LTKTTYYLAVPTLQTFAEAMAIEVQQVKVRLRQALLE
jgi:hypothetical protein